MIITPSSREGLKKIVGQCQDIAVADEASDGATLMQKLKESNRDVIILDISLPGDNGLDIPKDLRRAGVYNTGSDSQYAFGGAKAVKQALVDRGLDEAMFTTRGVGASDQPVAGQRSGGQVAEPQSRILLAEIATSRQ